MHRSWNILNWIVRGINSSNKWLAISNKIEELGCAVIYFQETKREVFYSSYLKNLCPRRINKFDYTPSVGSSGGLLVAWNDSIFQGECLFKNNFSISIRFISVHTGASWILTNIYGPCEGRIDFMNWLKNIQMPMETNWIIAGDFNYTRYPSNRNSGIGDVNQMLQFNEAISSLALVEIPLKGRSYTWSNMPEAPLIEKNDGVFTYENWSTDYPNTLVTPLSKPVSDHTPCVISIDTSIPKSQLFRFENFWLEHNNFKETVQSIWSQPLQEDNSAKLITAKSKRLLEKGLKICSKNISNLAGIIQATNAVILMWDMFEEFRELSLVERNGRDMLKEHFLKILSFQRIYWRQRATIRWVKFGDENSKFFQAKATIKYRHNFIQVLQDDQGNEHCDHHPKVVVLWKAFKERLGQTITTSDPLNLTSLIKRVEGLEELERPFSKKKFDEVVKQLPADKAPGPDGFNGDLLMPAGIL